jgi:hypothetical protein
MTKLTVTKLPVNSNIILKQIGGKDFFISSNDSIILSPSSLANILKFLVIGGYISHKLLEGVLEDYFAVEKEGKDVR